MGQLQDKAASDALSNILKDGNEHPMVRHEAAEALGSIAGITTEYWLSNDVSSLLKYNVLVFERFFVGCEQSSCKIRNIRTIYEIYKS